LSQPVRITASHQYAAARSYGNNDPKELAALLKDGQGIEVLTVSANIIDVICLDDPPESRSAAIPAPIQLQS
jgi:hypothetical protein